MLPAATFAKLAKGTAVYEHMTAIPDLAAAFSLLWLPGS